MHFPIALLPAAVLFDALALTRRARSLSAAAVLLYALAALGAWASYVAGEAAADSLGLLAPGVQARLNQHSDLGHYSFWLLGGLAAARVLVELWDRERRRRAPRWLLLAVAVAAIGLVGKTADVGGALVYRHGVAVSTGGGEPATEPEAPNAASADAEPAASRLTETPGGGLAWRPRAGDRDALGAVLAAAPGSGLGAISWLPPQDGEPGLGLSVDGEAWLMLPRAFGDAQVELAVALEDFAGAIGPVHHVRSAGDAGFFVLETAGGEAVLGSIEAGAVRELDRQPHGAPPGVVRLTVSAIGRHVRGLVDGELAVHGHEPPLAGGACGLLVRGRGTLRIVALEVSPTG